MNSSYYLTLRKNTSCSLTHPIKEPFYKKRKPQLKDPILTKQQYHPDFLHFSARQRQKANFLNIQFPQILNQKSQQQKDAAQRIAQSFHMKFSTKSKFFSSKNKQFTKGAQLSKTQRNIRTQRKYRLTMNKNFHSNSNEQPCVGTYQAKPQFIMKRLSKYEIFSKGASHYSTNKQNFSFITNYIQNDQFLDEFQTNNLRETKFQRLSRKIKPKNQKFSNKESKTSKQKKTNSQSLKILNIKCFDMSRQTSRGFDVKLSKKTKKNQLQNDYVERLTKKQTFMPLPLTGFELQSVFDNQKKKYKIAASYGVFNTVKFSDVFKNH